MILKPMIENPIAGPFVKHVTIPETKPPIPTIAKENTVANKTMTTDQIKM